jgi:uncharacterized protein (TIGR03437 family)
MAFGQATTVTPLDGNGQLICTNCFRGVQPKGNFDPLKVRVTDANGNPAQNATVTWTVTSGTFALAVNQTSFATPTDNSGIAISPAISPTGTSLGGPTLPLVQGTVTATAGSGLATFYLTQAFADFSGQAFVNVPTISPELGVAYQGPAGTQGSPNVNVRVTSTISTVPNVAVRLRANTDPATGPRIACATGPGADVNSVVTDASGNATCTPIFGGSPGTGQFFIDIGGVLDNGTGTPSFYLSKGPYNFTVTAGQPGGIQLISGNNQNATAGNALGASLVAKVVDVGGNSLAGQNVVWSVTPSGFGQLTNTTTSSDVNGQVSTNITLASSAAGAGQVKVALASDPTKSVTFNVTAIPLITITGVQIVSGNNQSVQVNQGFSPLIVQVTASNGQPAANVSVTFTFTGPVTLSSTTATTNSAGQAQVTAQAGATAGAATVTATSGNFSQTFSLTVAPPGPVLTATSFYNGASFVQGALSPCSIATIFASGLAPGLQGAISGVNIFGPLPFQVANDRVTVNNVPAPIYNVANLNGQEQLTFQVPCNAPAGSGISITVSTAGGASATVNNITLQAASPGIFMTTSSDGVQRAVALRPDGSFVSPENPARRGEIIHVYVTGLGPTVPAVGTNSLPVPGVDAMVQGIVVAGITNTAGQGAGLRVTGARLSPDLVGIYDVPVQIPSDAQTGSNVTFSVALIPSGSSTPVYSQPVKLPVL